MQGAAPNNQWFFPIGTLGELTADAHRRARMLEPAMPDLLRRARDVPTPPSFRAALRQPSVTLITEVKRASPSKGAIATNLDATRQAQAYETGGAAAVSVLTETTRFGGSLRDLEDVTAAVKIPVMRKDFIVHPVQLYEARAYGAAAALLIVRALSPVQLAQLMKCCDEVGLDALIEVRDEAELDRALDAGARIVGVNNRNLETLEINTTTATRLIPLIPADVVAVAESGITCADDMLAPARAGADAVLVGSVISASAYPALAVRDLASIPRVGR